MSRRWVVLGLAVLAGCGRKGALKLPPEPEPEPAPDVEPDPEKVPE